MKTITVTGYKRPLLFRRMLESLAANRLDGWRIEIQLEPGDPAAAYIAAAAELLAGFDYAITLNERRLGVLENPFELLDRVFRNGAELVVYVEEDLLLAPDVTALADWYHTTQGEQYMCLSLLAGGCGSYGFISYPDHQDLLFISELFNSWGFVLTRHSWHTHFRPRWKLNDPMACDHDGVITYGWDWSVYHYLNRTPDLHALSPVTARATHTGREDGVHMLPEWHDLAFEGLQLASAPSGERAYRVVAIPELPAPVRRHAMMWRQMIAAMLMLTDMHLLDAPALRARIATLERNLAELQSSRWRQLGRRLGLARKASFEP